MGSSKSLALTEFVLIRYSLKTLVLLKMLVQLLKRKEYYSGEFKSFSSVKEKENGQLFLYPYQNKHKRQ